MEKFKEKILNIGKRKNCFIALLLVALLAFGIVTGLRGVNSGEIKADALSAPQTKNLDLNGIRYTYQTSLSELKNTYGLFNNNYTRKFFEIYEGEGLVTLNLDSLNNSTPSGSYEMLKERYNNAINENIYFLDKNKNKINTNSENISKNNNNIASISKEFELNGIEVLQPNSLEKNYLKINFLNLLNYKIDYTIDNEEYNVNLINSTFTQTQSLILTIVYSNQQTNTTEQALHDSSIVYNYALNKPINYLFELPYKKGYDIALIYASFENQDNTTIDNAIFGLVPKQYWLASTQRTQQGFITINDKINFINNNDANIISFESDYNFGDMINTYPYFKGNLLLSKYKADEKMLEFVRQHKLDTQYILQTFDKPIYFGGNFANNKPVNYIYYTVQGDSLPGGPAGFTVEAEATKNIEFPVNQDLFFTYFNVNEASNFVELNINYEKQNQLIYIKDMRTLREGLQALPIAGSGTFVYQGENLSAQIEDILYSVNYIGNVEQEEFDEKVQEDLENLAKLTGLGAFIGLVIGILTGNPGLGLAIGGAIGALSGIFPLIIDALQAIFGYDFLSGLYNFFKSITSFFVNIVDTIFNFLLSIITNPFVLVLIVIIVLLYVFVIRKR